MLKWVWNKKGKMLIVSIILKALQWPTCLGVLDIWLEYWLKLFILQPQITYSNFLPIYNCPSFSCKGCRSDSPKCLWVAWMCSQAMDELFKRVCNKSLFNNSDGWKWSNGSHTGKKLADRSSFLWEWTYIAAAQG